MQNELQDIKRIVIKIGTSTLAHSTGRLNLRLFERIIKIVSDLKNMGKEVVIVSSGAIGVGAGTMGLSERPREKIDKQAAAAVGQCELMSMYSNNFMKYGHKVAQILLTKDVIKNDVNKTNAKNTFMRLIHYGIIPIVNENDTISTEEAEFGDNDRLSAVVATLCEAQLLIILTDIDGVYDKNPRTNADAKLIPYITSVEDVMDVADGAGSALGTGGMITKLMAAKIAEEAGISTLVMNGANPERLYDIEGRDVVGTLICGGRGNG